MADRWAGPAGALLVVVLAAALSAGMVEGRGTSDLLFYACAVAQSGLCLAAGWLAVMTRSRAVLPILIGGGVLLRLWFIFQVPTLSGDLYRYIWDGRILNAGFDPYLHVPADPLLAPLRDPAQYGFIDKRDYAVTIYPPVAEAFFALVTRISGSVVAMKFAMTLCEAAACLAVAHLLVRLERPLGLIAIYLLHPAPIWEIAGNGHVDAAMMALFFPAFALGGGSQPFLTAAMLTLGTLVKPTAALGLPATWRPVQVLLPLFVLALAAACYGPFVVDAGTGVVGFLPSYAREQGFDAGQGFYPLALLTRLGLFRPAMTTLYAVGAAAVLIGVALWTRRRGDMGLEAGLAGSAVLLVLFLLLLSPTFPWYFLVTLPFVPLLGLWTPFTLATGGFLLYAFNPDQPAFFARWSLLMAVVTAAAIRDFAHLRRWEATHDA